MRHLGDVFPSNGNCCVGAQGWFYGGSMGHRWNSGEVIVRREVLGLAPISSSGPAPAWHGRAWEALPVYVVEDSDDALITYIAPRAEIGFADGPWPTRDGRHPWSGRQQWQGHGSLMIQRPGEHHAVWHFWTGAERQFACWYINLQTAFVRTAIGYDTQDLELDIIVLPDGTWSYKDLDLLDERVAEGRYSRELVQWVTSLGDQLGSQLDAGAHWWDHRWADWTPHPGWEAPALIPGWQAQAAHTPGS